jgi:hypothetical protein
VSGCWALAGCATPSGPTACRWPSPSRSSIEVWSLMEPVWDTRPGAGWISGCQISPPGFTEVETSTTCMYVYSRKLAVARHAPALSTPLRVLVQCCQRFLASTSSCGCAFPQPEVYSVVQLCVLCCPTLARVLLPFYNVVSICTAKLAAG